MRDRLTTLVEVSGLAVIVASVATVSRPVAGVVAGVFLVAVGYLEGNR